MKPRRIYYRKKGKSIVIEGRQKGKPILIWTLPNPTLLLEHLANPKFSYLASFLTKEKLLKIWEKVRRLDYKTKRKRKGA